MRKTTLAATLAVLSLALALSATATPVTVSINVMNPGAAVSPNAIGLSYETSLMQPDTNGVHYFRPENKPLLRMFKSIGVRSLRIGGNSVDAPAIPVPSEADIKSFFDFARAAGVKVIYSVRLEDPTNNAALPAFAASANIESAANIARYIHKHYADVLDCFAIGNEPSYFKEYSLYSAKWKAIHDAIVAVYPEARFCGPDQNPSPELDKDMVHDFGNASGRLKLITQHSYPFGCSYKNPNDRKDVSKLIPFDAAESREKMLSPEAYATYEKIYAGIASAIQGSDVGYRLSECNSYWFSGLKGASDSYAAALWAVDYLYWWTGHGADGLNFHTGDRTGGELSMPCRYAAFVTSGNGYEVRPLAYGMKLFGFGANGKQLPLTISPATNIVAFATLDYKTLAVTIINKDHGAHAEEQTIEIDLNTPFARNPKAQIIYLRAKGNDIAGGSGDVTLGDASIEADGTWKGHWRGVAAKNNVFTVTMPPASAAVVEAIIR